jgi:hypothetical protein
MQKCIFIHIDNLKVIERHAADVIASATTTSTTTTTTSTTTTTTNTKLLLQYMKATYSQKFSVSPRRYLLCLSCSVTHEATDTIRATLRMKQRTLSVQRNAWSNGHYPCSVTHEATDTIRATLRMKQRTLSVQRNAWSNGHYQCNVTHEAMDTIPAFRAAWRTLQNFTHIHRYMSVWVPPIRFLLCAVRFLSMVIRTCSTGLRRNRGECRKCIRTPLQLAC